MAGPRSRARRNLVLFWLAVVFLPLILVAGCLGLMAATWPQP